MAYKKGRPHIPEKVKRQVMTEAGHCCIVRHCNEHIVEIHHIDENRENNDPSNLAVLCDKHHKLAHNKTISRMDLREYKKLLFSPLQPIAVGISEHDKKLLKYINELFSYDTILLIKNEHFQKIVKQEVIDPFIKLFYRSKDPLFRFTDQKLESIRIELLNKAEQFFSHFEQQSAGLENAYEYIDISEIQRIYPQMVEYWSQYSDDTVELANGFCNSMEKLRAEQINYEI
ncbi:HNH endonuclease signature motif containing protein [Agarilytica rhodophyticola]|uniref:HNH endonuclease signature motif containing protein n=1 Tax=Agarilytica rhodophyticola TaxID=1737490 RepID=UPI000B34272E|nr:HNH endonuclease signature motif containing protein [Agarilytica rhodophyticola]